jgi:hypothetical protein
MERRLHDANAIADLVDGKWILEGLLVRWLRCGLGLETLLLARLVALLPFERLRTVGDLRERAPKLVDVPVPEQSHVGEALRDRVRCLPAPRVVNLRVARIGQLGSAVPK